MSKLIGLLFFAAIQGIGTAVVCWYLYQTEISMYQNMKNLDVESLSQQLANEKTNNNKPRFESEEAAHAWAEHEVATAKKIQATSDFKIKVCGGVVTTAIGIAGSVVSILVLTLLRLMKRPSDDWDLSPFDRFFKGPFAEFVVTTIFTMILGAFIAFLAADWTLQKM